MSHTVTVTRTTNVRTTTSSTSVILFNIGFFKTLPGLLKLFQVLLGAVAVGISAYCLTHWWKFRLDDAKAELFFLLIATTALITTACIVIAAAASVTTASIMPKTLFEVIYHGIIFILYTAAAINYLVKVCKWRDARYSIDRLDAALAGAIIGLIIAVLYLLSTVYAVRSYRRG